MREATSSFQPESGEISLFRLIILPFSQRKALIFPSSSEVPTTWDWALMSRAVLGASSPPRVPRSAMEPCFQITPCPEPFGRSQDPMIVPVLLIACALQVAPPANFGSDCIFPACQRKAWGLPLGTTFASPTTSPLSLMSRALL